MVATSRQKDESCPWHNRITLLETLHSVHSFNGTLTFVHLEGTNEWMDVGEKSGGLQLRTFLEIFRPALTWEKEIFLSAAGEDAGYFI